MVKKTTPAKGTELGEETKRIDMNSSYLGVSRMVLMENAGREVARICEKHSKIAVFAGTGNNGGDGLAAARHLSGTGKIVRVYAIHGTRTQECERNLGIIKKLDSVELSYIRDSSEFAGINKELRDFDAVIDALIGAGARGEPREPVKSAVHAINSARAFKVSVDVPTPGVKPDLTLSLHFRKTKDAKVVPIGIPKEAETCCGPGDLITALPVREGFEHKGDHGRLLVVGGSRDYPGTPAIVSRAAARTGVDLITVACPSLVAERMCEPDLMVKTLDSEFYLSDIDVNYIAGLNYDSMVLGNGMGVTDETRSFARKLLKKTDKPVVLDADALKVVSVKDLGPNHILTPHTGEFQKLFGECPGDLLERAGLVEEKAKKTTATIVLKGPVDVISNGSSTRMNKTGNPGMTVGGTGDVLAGIIGALSTSAEKFDAACAAAFLSGLSGDLCNREMGYSFTAIDVIEKIPEAIRYSKGFE
ncbi:MAG: NAD(P)H-hydrate dehydratase [Candidatus Altiarchaeota archaeon]|nr:NAD(P)H-hydrate dehydratase [Candidatus Altiarchaeota archaeon]